MMIRATPQMIAHAKKVGRRVGSNAGQGWLHMGGKYTPGEWLHFRDELLDGLVIAGIPREHRRRKYVVALMEIAEASFHRRMAERHRRLIERWKR